MPSRMPSPHVVLWQLSVPCEISPPLQTHSCSTLQREEHPSPSCMLPSSQSSPALTRRPSPQRAWQKSRRCAEPAMHTHPGSMVQFAAQPSAPTVPSSSHVSLPARRPSPQTVRHTLGPGPIPGHLNPASTAHCIEQPSPVRTLPSSHSSLPSTFESPHSTREQTSARVVLPPRHAYPASTMHTSEQPSETLLLPSSQLSQFSLRPLPHAPSHDAERLTSCMKGSTSGWHSSGTSSAKSKTKASVEMTVPEPNSMRFPSKSALKTKLLEFVPS
mmetsp:Transcript_54284/g.176444  ORF Transcript_54284/g.176444 Transcript_54284/m.176444 type:complete len:273 (+) Transcript_54284:5680-6498(+)